jgi:hypothetical protein
MALPRGRCWRGLPARGVEGLQGIHRAGAEDAVRAGRTSPKQWGRRGTDAAARALPGKSSPSRVGQVARAREDEVINRGSFGVDSFWPLDERPPPLQSPSLTPLTERRRHQASSNRRRRTPPTTCCCCAPPSAPPVARRRLAFSLWKPSAQGRT